MIDSLNVVMDLLNSFRDGNDLNLRHPEVYKHSHLAYSQPSFLLYGDSVFKSCEVTQQGDPESPASFSDSIQDLTDSLESKRNLCYLDDGNLSDDYRNVLKDLKNLLKRKKCWDSK